jgi:excisionase family DNA binding protein
MEIYTLKEASRKTKIGVETLKRACQEGLIKATRLANSQWRIAESALEEDLHKGLDLRGLTKRTGFYLLHIIHIRQIIRYNKQSYINRNARESRQHVIVRQTHCGRAAQWQYHYRAV